jgi:uncharacterized protein YegP (UPF0339 family)
MRVFSLSCVVLALALLVGFTGPAVGGGGKKKDQAKTVEPKGTSAPHFEVAQDKKKMFRFTFKGSDGRTLFMSAGSGYKTREDCVKAIESIRETVGKAKIIDKKK